MDLPDVAEIVLSFPGAVERSLPFPARKAG